MHPSMRRDALAEPLLDPPEILKLMTLALAASSAPRLHEVHGHRAGDWPGTQIGQGLDFEESRPYAPSDAMRDMDWRSTARLGHAYVKTYREERQPICVVVVDRGALMRFGTQMRLKVTQAARAAIWIGTQAMASAAAVSVVLWNTEQDDWLGPFHHRDQWLNAIDHIVSPTPPIELGALEPENDKARLRHLLERNPAGCRLFLLSDFLWFDKDHSLAIAALAEANSLCCIRISDPIEREIINASGAWVSSPRSGLSIALGSGALQWVQSANRLVADQREVQRTSIERLGGRLLDLCSTRGSFEGFFE
ncbi:MAG: hypothetical protein RJA77_127 [Pseudomonadota bacterium]